MTKAEAFCLHAKLPVNFAAQNQSQRTLYRSQQAPTTGDPVSNSSVDDLVEAGSEYHAGFVTDVESETLPPGLDESVVRYISAQKNEPNGSRNGD